MVAIGLIFDLEIDFYFMGQFTAVWCKTNVDDWPIN